MAEFILDITIKGIIVQDQHQMRIDIEARDRFSFFAQYTTDSDFSVLHIMHGDILHGY